MAEIDLANKVALIVGAGSGLSASIARSFAGAGMKIALAARSVDDLAARWRARSAQKPSPAMPLQRDAVKKLYADVAGALGDPFAVVYNASYRTRGPFIDLDPAEVEKALAVIGLRRISGGAGGRAPHAGERRRRDPVHRRVRERQGLCAVGALRDGKIRAARARPEHAARRTCAPGHPYLRPCGAWTAASARGAAPAARRSSGRHARPPTPLRRAISISSPSRAACGPGKSKCVPGWRSFEEWFPSQIEPDQPAPSYSDHLVGTE